LTINSPAPDRISEVCDDTTGLCVAAAASAVPAPVTPIALSASYAMTAPTSACLRTSRVGMVVEDRSCRTDADCLAGFVCDTDAQQCHSARCTNDSRCLAGKSCRLGQCAPGGCSVASARDARPKADGLVWLMMAVWLLNAAAVRAVA
jgi:hypothetical protein